VERKNEGPGEMLGSSQSPKKASPPFLVREFRAAVRGKFKGRGWDSSVIVGRAELTWLEEVLRQGRRNFSQYHFPEFKFPYDHSKDAATCNDHHHLPQRPILIKSPSYDSHRRSIAYTLLNSIIYNSDDVQPFGKTSKSSNLD